MLSPATLVSELVGTFVFLAVILTTGQAIPISLTLAACIFLSGGSGHFNPVVSLCSLVKGSIDANTCLLYVLLQVTGGLLAVWYASSLKLKK